MRGKTKQEKGITLIALIITIVVLLILAVVAINSIQNDGILGHAQNAASTYNQAVQNEQSILDYYEGYLAGTLWEQNGTKVTRKNGDGTTIELDVGDSVLLGEEKVSYSANNYSDWKVLGVENGKLLLVTTSTIGSLELEGWEGYSTGIAQLDKMCSAYLNTTYASEARSIRIEDINRVTGYDPTKDVKWPDYGKTYTYTTDGFVHPDGRVIGTGEGEVTSITEVDTYYRYNIESYEIGDAAISLLCSNHYWMASTCVMTGYGRSDSDHLMFALRAYGDEELNCYYYFLCSNDEEDGFVESREFGVRAVVSLKSSVQVTKVEA